jgi:hypothetical protein
MTFVYIVVALFILSGFFSFKKKQPAAPKIDAGRVEALREDAERKGWRVEAYPDAVRYYGTTEGLSWTFTTTSPRGNLGTSSLWETGDATFAAPRAIWRMPQHDDQIREAPEFVRRIYFGPIAEALNASEADVLVLANAEPWTDAMPLVDAADIDDVAMIVAWHRGLQIVRWRPTHNVDEIEATARLGAALARLT